MESLDEEEPGSAYVAVELTNMIYDLSTRGDPDSGDSDSIAPAPPARYDFEEAMGASEGVGATRHDIDSYIERALEASNEVDSVRIEQEDVRELEENEDDLRSTYIGSPAFTYAGDSGGNKPPVTSSK